MAWLQIVSLGIFASSPRSRLVKYAASSLRNMLSFLLYFTLYILGVKKIFWSDKISHSLSDLTLIKQNCRQVTGSVWIITETCLSFYDHRVAALSLIRFGTPGKTTPQRRCRANSKTPPQVFDVDGELYKHYNHPETDVSGEFNEWCNRWG